MADHPTTTKTGTGFERLLTARDAANLLRLSASWLAKARMRGDGPPFSSNSTTNSRSSPEASCNGETSSVTSLPTSASLRR